MTVCILFSFLLYWAFLLFSFSEVSWEVGVPQIWQSVFRLSHKPDTIYCSIHENYRWKTRKITNFMNCPANFRKSVIRWAKIHTAVYGWVSAIKSFYIFVTLAKFALFSHRWPWLNYNQPGHNRLWMPWMAERHILIVSVEKNDSSR